MITLGKVKENDDVFYKHFEGMYLVLTSWGCTDDNSYTIFGCAENQEKRRSDCYYHFFKAEGCCESLKEHRENWGDDCYEDAPGRMTIPKKYIKRITMEEWADAPELGFLETLQDTEEGRKEFENWYNKQE